MNSPANGKSELAAKFAGLPALLTRRQFLDTTGLSRRDLDALREDGAVQTWQRAGKGYHKYYKSDAARICGIAS